MKPKIAILTTLTDVSPAYSLTGIILDQARTLAEHGYEVDLLLLRNFKASDKKLLEDDPLINPCFVLPQTILVDYQPTQKAVSDSDKGKKLGFESQVKVHLEGNDREDGYMKILEPYDVVIDHDIMFLSWFIPMNKALRAVMDAHPDKNYLHWVHSRPTEGPPGTCYPSTLRYTSAPGTYVYLNDTHRQLVSICYQLPMRRVATVYNAKDIRDVCDFQLETRQLISEYGLMDHQILQSYAISTPRWTDKGVRQLLKLWGKWREQKIHARLVLVTAHSNSERDKPHIKAIEDYTKKCGLRIDDDVILTHRFANLMIKREKSNERKWREWLHCVPREVVRDLTILSNIFVFPTSSEVCSLVQAEAAVLGKPMILNQDFEPLFDFTAKGGVMKYSFTNSDPDGVKADPNFDPDRHYAAVAREVWLNLGRDLTFINTTQARTRTYNRDWIFENQLEPLLWEGFARRRHSLEEQTKSVIEVIETSKQLSKSECQRLSIEQAKKGITGPSVPENASSPDYEDPQPGDVCSVFGKCSAFQRERCYAEANHCPMIDEELS